LMAERLKNYKTNRENAAKTLPINQKDGETSSEGSYPSSEIDYKGNVLNKLAKDFYETHGCKVVEPALESTKPSKAGKIAMTTKHCLKYSFGMCKSPQKLYLVDEKGKKYALNFNCDKCEMEIIF